MNTLVLVDGSSYLYRAFHALPDLRTSRGEPTGAIRGVLAMLRRLVTDGNPDYFAVVFDAPGKTFRDDWYPEYKANRPPMPTDLAMQIPALHDAIRAQGWPLVMIDGVEADDVIGTLVQQAQRAGIKCIVSTGDKDLAQLVGPHVTLVNTMSNETLDEAGVIEKFGVKPEQILDYLTLVGDSVDNVPGVAKVGAKTAAKWLNQYGSLANLMEHAQEIGGVVGENLRAALDWLPQGKRLLTVRCDLDLPFKPNDLPLQSPDVPRLSALYEKFEFRSWAKELQRAEHVTTEKETGTAAAGVTAEGAPCAPSRVTETLIPPAYETLLTAEAIERWLQRVAAAELVCVGVQTTSLDPMQAKIVGLSFSIAAHVAAYIPLAHRYADAPEQLRLDDVLARLKPWFEDAGKRKLAQNAKYVQHVLANHGIALAGVAHDTLLQSYVLESHRPHELDSLALRHLNVTTIPYEDVCGKGVNQLCFDQVSVARATEYAGEAADLTLQVHHTLQPRLATEDGLRYVYEEIELPTREVLFKMERHGVLLDTALLAGLSRSFGERLMTLEREAHAAAGQPFNLGSPKQLGEILFTRLGLPVRRKTATGQPSTDEEVLQELAADYPLPKIVLEHRGVSKLKSTYTDKLPQMVNAQTGRVHTTYGQAVAVTGRLASNDPNLQNIPVRTAEGRRIREAFVAAPGSLIVSADYSQIELRIMAHLSGDPRLLEAFTLGEDIHKATAAEIFGVPIDEVTSVQRRYIKAVNFGLIYGMSSFGLAAQLGIERSAAQAYIDKYFARYPGVADYMQRTRELARTQGYVETVFGRRLWLTDIKAGGGPRRQAAERAAINAPMQGTAADLIKLAMIAVQRWLERERFATKLIMQVHDELVLEVPERELALVKESLPHLMTNVVDLRVPLQVETGAGPNWDKAH